MSQKVEKWFTVVNDLKQSIFVQTYPDLTEIRAIDPPSLVIPASSTGGFKIVF